MTPAECAAIITAAGASRRMGAAGKKEYRGVEGVPVLARALCPFVVSGRFSRIVVTVPPGDIDVVASLVRPHVMLDRSGPIVTFVEGGVTRQESVFGALRALKPAAPGLVLIHDGARPWISRELIDSVIETTGRRGACVPVLEAAEAVKQVAEGGLIVQHIPRHDIRFAQTPQGFFYDSILAAHEKAHEQGILCADDGELYSLFVGPVSWVCGEPENRKITWPHDLELA
jgi:2-C-methyl-D-erythritol 4-phosphate cytidylyltransferase